MQSVLKKSKVSSTRKSQIQKDLKSGHVISTKGLKGSTLKAAQQYNSAVKSNNQNANKVKLTRKNLTTANKNVKTQQTNLTNAKKNLTATQRAILSTQKSKKTFVAQNNYWIIRHQHQNKKMHIVNLL